MYLALDVAFLPHVFLGVPSCRAVTPLLGRARTGPRAERNDYRRSTIGIRLRGDVPRREQRGAHDAGRLLPGSPTALPGRRWKGFRVATLYLVPRQ